MVVTLRADKVEIKEVMPAKRAGEIAWNTFSEIFKFLAHEPRMRCHGVPSNEHENMEYTIAGTNERRNDIEELGGRQVKQKNHT